MWILQRPRLFWRSFAPGIHKRQGKPSSPRTSGRHSCWRKPNFPHSGSFVHNDPTIQQAWENDYNAAGAGPTGHLSVTGAMGPIENIHPSIKNVAGANPAARRWYPSTLRPSAPWKGAELNAPTGKYASFAYTSALNHLLADRDHVFRIGDATVVCWSRNAKPAYAALFEGGCFRLRRPSYTESDLRGMVKSLCAGQPVIYQEDKLDPNMDFYVLGLSPNAARLSVRFFLHNTFKGFLDNVQAHYRRLEVVRPAYDKFETLPLWRLLNETVNQNSRDKSPLPTWLARFCGPSC